MSSLQSVLDGKPDGEFEVEDEGSEAQEDEAGGADEGASDENPDEGDGDDDQDQDQNTDDSDDDELPADVKGLRQALSASRAQARERGEQLANLQGRMETFERVFSSQINQPSDLSDEEKEARRDQMLTQFTQDPEGFMENITKSATSDLRVELARDMVRAQYTDYDDVIGKFVDAAKKDPSLNSQMLAQPNPALWAYNKAKDIARFENLGVSSLAEFEAKMRKQWEAEQAEKNKSGSRVDAASKVPKSTASSRGEGPPPDAQEFEGPTPLSKLLPD